jgi:adenylate cyclase class 2
MTYETETKILNVDCKEIGEKFLKLGAKQIASNRLFVEWFKPKGATIGDKLSWFLRIREYSSGKCEVTWKGKSDVLGDSRQHKEINFIVSDLEQVKDLFKELGLEKYAYQEKDRTTWIFKDWQFDLDQYPNMPAYLEIEGKDEAHIQEAISLLGLEENKKSPEGERVLIQNEYGLNWFNMKF